MQNANEKIIIIVIILLAVFLRVGGNFVSERFFFHKPFILFGDDFEKSIESDSVWYDGMARAFLKGKGISSMDTNRVAYEDFQSWVDLEKIDDTYYAHKTTPPFYTLFLGFFYWLGGANTLSYFIPQVILGVLTCLFIYLLAREIFNKKVAALAGLAVAFYPDLIFWTYKIRVETLFIFLIALGFWLLIKGNFQKSSFLTSMGAVVFGLACLTRITLIPFIPLLFLWQVFSSKKDKKRAVLFGLLTISLIALVLLPWCIRNFLVFGKFTPLTDEAYGFFAKNDPEYYPETEYYHRSYNSLPTRLLGFIKDHPKRYLEDSLKRFITFWSPYTASMKKIAKLYKGLTWLVIFPLAFWGLISALRKSWSKSGLPRTRTSSGRGLLIIFIFYYVLLHSAATCVDSGLVDRYPIQPFLCIFAAYGFWLVYKKFKYKSNENLTY